MTVARDELGSPVLDDGERAEPVILQFEDPLMVVKGSRSSRQRHRLECHAVSVSNTTAKVGRIEPCSDRQMNRRNIHRMIARNTKCGSQKPSGLEGMGGSRVK
jgi:hypothetical protein